MDSPYVLYPTSNSSGGGAARVVLNHLHDGGDHTRQLRCARSMPARSTSPVSPSLLRAFQAGARARRSPDAPLTPGRSGDDREETRWPRTGDRTGGCPGGRSDGPPRGSPVRPRARRASAAGAARPCLVCANSARTWAAHAHRGSNGARRAARAPRRRGAPSTRSASSKQAAQRQLRAV